ncbi:MAG: DUF4058 family protein [Gemmataceae bacterium]
MPLRDHFHPPLAGRRSWDELHGMWPSEIVRWLKPRLPPGYTAGPNVHLGRDVEIDAGAFEGDDAAPEMEGGGGVAVLTMPQPTLAVATALPDPDEYEVRVYDARRGRQLVAAIEIVSPSNKDRPRHRQAFVDKCVALLREGVSVTVVDVVTDSRFNLYTEMLASIGQSDPTLGAEPPGTYVAACRWTERKRGGLLQAWAWPLTVGHPLPTTPLWLTERGGLMLELEATYEQACSDLGIA